MPTSSKFSTYLSLTLLSIFCVYQFTLQGAVGILSEGMEASLHADDTAISFLSSSFFYSYILMQIPVGFIFDHYGIRKVASLALACVFISCLTLGLGDSLAWAIVSRILMGLGCSFGFVGMLLGIKRWFAAKHFAFLTAVVESLGLVGTAMLNRLLSELVYHYNWRVAILACSAFALILALSIFICVKDEVSEVVESSPQHSILTSLKTIIQDKSIWALGLYAMCTFSVITVFASLWGIPYLEQHYHLDIVAATTAISMIYVGAAVSSPFLGWLAGQVKCSSLMSLGSVGSLGLMSYLVYGPKLNLIGLYSVLFGIGFFCSSYQLTFTLVSRHLPNHLQGAGLGFANMITMMGGPILQPLIGFLLSMTAHHHSLLSYQMALGVIPLVLVLATFIAYRVKEPEAMSLMQWLSNSYIFRNKA